MLWLTWTRPTEERSQTPNRVMIVYKTCDVIAVWVSCPQPELFCTLLLDEAEGRAASLQGNTTWFSSDWRRWSEGTNNTSRGLLRCLHCSFVPVISSAWFSSENVSQCGCNLSAGSRRPSFNPHDSPGWGIQTGILYTSGLFTFWLECAVWLAYGLMINDRQQIGEHRACL